MAGDPLWINASAGAPAYTAGELRQLFGVPMQYGGRLLGARAGVRPGGGALDTSIVGSTITVKTGMAFVDPALTSTQGGYWVAITPDETHTLTAAHATNPRKDITVLRVYDHDEDASGLRLARSEYIVGTAAPSPVEPSVPAGAFKLSTIDVPSVANGGPPVVTQAYPFTVATGGVLPVRNETERSAVTTPFDGMVIYRQDRDWVEIHDGTAWRVQGTAICSSTADRDSAITSPVNGQLAFTTDTNILYVRASGAWTEYLGKLLPRGLVATTTFTTDSATWTTSEVITRTVTFTAVAGRKYKLELDSGWNCTGLSSQEFRFRWATGASLTTAGTLFFSRRARVHTSGAFDHIQLSNAGVSGITAGQITIGVGALSLDGGITGKFWGASTNESILSVYDVGAA